MLDGVPLHNRFAIWLMVLGAMLWDLGRAACCLTGESDWLVTGSALPRRGRVSGLPGGA